MFNYYTAKDLRELGKRYESVAFERMTSDATSAEKLLISIILRFILDIDNPTMFIMIPKAGDEPVESLVFLRDLSSDELKRAIKASKDIANELMCKCEIITYAMNERVVLLIKEDFLHGEWSGYETYLSCEGGLSVSAK